MQALYDIFNHHCDNCTDTMCCTFSAYVTCAAQTKAAHVGAHLPPEMTRYRNFYPPVVLIYCFVFEYRWLTPR